MLDNPVIQAKDCLPFHVAPEWEEAIRHFALSYDCTQNVFRFSSRYSRDNDSKILEYDYWQRVWRAGRYVGNARFIYKDKAYELNIVPRFGEIFLFKLIEEIFNVKLITSNAKLLRKDEFSFLIKRLISFIWLHKLAHANRHGLPRHSIKKKHLGSNVKGRINIRETIIPLFTTQRIASNYYDKEIDRTIAEILAQAYWILVKEYELHALNFPENAREIINLLKCFPQGSRRITKLEYEKIQYKEIFRPFKEVVDFSWDIINNNASSSSDTTNLQKGFSFFIDMAEIWELYIRSALDKKLKKNGWKTCSDKVEVYKDTFFKRHMIPDIVIQKEDRVAVFDAKYKAMNFNQIDVDRHDFFQIHTYMNYWAQEKKVIAGGLIYPLVGKPSANCQSPRLFNENGVNTLFLIDGIDVTSVEEFDYNKIEFLNRISVSLDVK